MVTRIRTIQLLALGTLLGHFCITAAFGANCGRSDASLNSSGECEIKNNKSPGVEGDPLRSICSQLRGSFQANGGAGFSSCKYALQRICADGRNYCDPGYACSTDNKCIPDEAQQKQKPAEKVTGAQTEDPDPYGSAGNPFREGLTRRKLQAQLRFNPNPLQGNDNTSSSQDQPSTDVAGKPEDRYSSTEWCSSKQMGQARKCADAPQESEAGSYKIHLNAACREKGYLVTVAAYDSNGVCSRKVISLSVEAAEQIVPSSKAPRILDAISTNDEKVMSCYRMRHEDGDCALR
jgi:hypothetical protein